jgi:predicted DNA-binding transcriptional regulator AlpA
MATVEHITGERLLKVEETAAIIGAAVGTLNRARVFGGNFPAYVKRGKSVRYKLSTVMKWMEDQEEHCTTSEIDAKKGVAA